MRISDWSSDVCSSDLEQLPVARHQPAPRYHSGHIVATRRAEEEGSWTDRALGDDDAGQQRRSGPRSRPTVDRAKHQRSPCRAASRSEEHTSELQSLMRISYAVFCLKKKKKTYHY